MGNLFCILCNFIEHLCHMVLQINKCLEGFQQIIIYKTIIVKLYFNQQGNVLSKTTILFRSSHQRYSIGKLLLQVSKYSQENTCIGVNKVAAFKCFPVNIAKFSRTSIKNQCFCLFQGYSLRHLEKIQSKDNLTETH